MSWSAIGAIADLVAALGVIGSLIYVAIQVRQNTKSVNRASAQAMLMSRAETNRFLAGDPALSDLFWRGGETPEALSEEEWRRYFWICSAALRPVEMAFLDHKDDHMRASLWEAQDNALKFWFSKPGYGRWLDEYGHTLHPDFKAHLDAIVEESTFSNLETAHLAGQIRDDDEDRRPPTL